MLEEMFDSVRCYLLKSQKALKIMTLFHFYSPEGA